MKALYCREFGPEDTLKVEEIDTPALADGHVRIAIKAAGLNFPDLLCVRGEYQIKPPLPFVPGGEGAGEITEVAGDVTGLRVGQRVLFTGLTGAFAAECVTPAGTVTPIPDAMSFEEAAGLTIVYATAYHALADRGDLKAGETLAVLGAAGGVGLAAVELGKALGARVIAAASNADKLAAASDHGADAGINYADADLKAKLRDLTDGAGPDVIFDPVGGSASEAAFRAINWGGRHLIIGFAAGDIPKLPLNLPLLKGASLVGVFWGAWAMRDPAGHGAAMQALFDLYAEGKIRPRIAARYPLEDFSAAFSDLSQRRAIGKVVFTP